MKLLREHINEKFTEDSDPIADMNIGMIHDIKLWMKSMGKLFRNKDHALACSAIYGKLDFVEYLLAAGANVHANNDYALRWASNYGHTGVVKVLLAAGADVHTYDDYALLWASVNGHTEVVKPLLAAGANVHADNDHALKWASVNGHTEVVKVLKDHIAKEKRKKVKESVNEKFTEDSDPIHDLGIGGISFEEKRKETIGAEYLKSSEWLDYLRSLIGKTISGDFGKKGIKTFKICHYESYNRGTRLNFYDEDDNLYLVQPDKRYIIR